MLSEIDQKLLKIAYEEAKEGLASYHESTLREQAA